MGHACPLRPAAAVHISVEALSRANPAHTSAVDLENKSQQWNRGRHHGTEANCCAGGRRRGATDKGDGGRCATTPKTMAGCNGHKKPRRGEMVVRHVRMFCNALARMGLPCAMEPKEQVESNAPMIYSFNLISILVNYTSSRAASPACAPFKPA